MAETTQYSTQYNAVYQTDPPDLLRPTEWGANIKLYFFDFTQLGAGDAGSLAYLVVLPPGYSRIILPASRLYFSAYGAARTLDLGWLAYTKIDRTAVAADPNGLDDGVDVSSAGSVNPAGTVGTHETKEFDAASEVTITAQVNDGSWPDAATLSGYFFVAHK